MMRQRRWFPRRSNSFWLLAAQRRRARLATVYLDANLYANANLYAEVHFFDQGAMGPLVALPAQRANAPRFCEWLMCLAVDPEFQEDRLADYQERFNDLWVPKFGQRAALVVYVWHVLRQSRLIDWIVRTFVLGSLV